jgi:hypothetical protein
LRQSSGIGVLLLLGGVEFASGGESLVLEDANGARQRGALGTLVGLNWGLLAQRASWRCAANFSTANSSFDRLHIAPLLGLDVGEPVCVRERRIVLDGQPVMLSNSYLPAVVVRGSAITEPDSGPGGIYARLTELGHEPTRFREDVRARMPQEHEITALDLSAFGTPVIEIVRTAFTADGNPIEVNEMTLDASAYVLRYDFEA